MLKILKQERRLLLLYRPDRNGVDWIDNDLQKKEVVKIRRVFTFRATNLVNNVNMDYGDEGSRTFLLGYAYGEFYKIDSFILDLKFDLLLHQDMEITAKTFIATRDISIFRKIDGLVDEPIIIGGNAEGSIPIEEFEELLKNFPTSTELNHYADARVSRVLKDYLGSMSDAQRRLNAYLSRKSTIHPKSRIQPLVSYEIQKFEFVRNELWSMLQNAESYNEKNWQKLIVGFLLLIYPKYIAVLENLHVKDFYSNPAKTIDRYIDLTLVDANGTIDVVEIKKPFANCLLSRKKYRDNYTPRVELSGSVMQVEKYLFHLSKWGREGEKEILNKWGAVLPNSFKIKITNPKAIIIIGRDSDFADDQRFDFEIIRRKYANIIDIMTYDDLIGRLNNIIAMINPNFSRIGSWGGQA